MYYTWSRQPQSDIESLSPLDWLVDYTLITVTSHERHGVSNHRQLDCLFNSLYGPTANTNTKALHYTLRCEGNHRWPTDSPKMAGNSESVSMSWRHQAGVPWVCITVSGTVTVPLSLRCRRYCRFKAKAVPSSHQPNAHTLVCYHYKFLSTPRRNSTWNEVEIFGFLIHDGVIKWKHFPRNCLFVRGIRRSPVNSPHKGQWRGALMFSLIRAWTSGWVNSGDAGDLRRHRAHYDVTAIYHHIARPCRHIDGSVEDCNNSIGNALEFTQSCAKLAGTTVPLLRYAPLTWPYGGSGTG